MADEELDPFATIEEFKARWPDMPVGADSFATTLLGDASQYMLDVCPTVMSVSNSTRRRVVCAVVKRSMIAAESGAEGMESINVGTGPFQDSWKPSNPHGDFYLTKQEKLSLGMGRQRAFSVDLLAGYDASG